MFELAHFVVSAEREWRDKAMKTYYEEGHPETQIWLWRHKTLFLVTGALVLLIMAGTSA